MQVTVGMYIKKVGKRILGYACLSSSEGGIKILKYY